MASTDSELAGLSSVVAFDPAPLQELADLGGAEMVQSVIEVFDGAVDEQLGQMLAALEEASVADLRTSAHRLKGSAGTVGAARLSKICQVFELAAAEGSVPDGLSADEIRASLIEAQRAMHAWASAL